MASNVPIITQKEILNVLYQVGAREGHTLLVHSFLGTFGKIPEGGSFQPTLPSFFSE